MTVPHFCAENFRAVITHVETFVVDREEKCAEATAVLALVLATEIVNENQSLL